MNPRVTYDIEVTKHTYYTGEHNKSILDVHFIKHNKRAIEKELKNLVKSRTIEYSIEYHSKDVIGFVNDQSNYGCVKLVQCGKEIILEEYIVVKM